MNQIVCVGDLMVDVLAQLPGPLAIGSDTPAPITLLGGGSAANTAAWLAVAGTATTFVGRVGDDELGRQAVAQLDAAGVETEVSVDPVRPTGTCIVLVDADGERTMVPAAGANSGLGEAPLPAELFTGGARLHLSGYALFNEGSRPAALALLGLARRRGCPISVDGASAAPLRDVGARRFLSWIGRGVLLIANVDEALVLAEATDAPAAARTLGERCGEAVVKLGSRGAVWSDGTDVVTAGSEPVDLVDTTGAGDAFAAGLLAARSNGDGIAASLAAANALAARAITQVGARPPRGARP